MTEATSQPGPAHAAAALLWPSAFRLLPLGAIRPAGWLMQQLHLQVNGLTGQLEELWAPVGPESAWKGGPGDDSDRAPCYLDGLVALAHLLDEPGLQGKVARWMDAIVASASEDGFFGPRSNDDWWPRMPALKALMGQVDATQDGRLLDLMDRYFRYQTAQLPGRPLTDWGRARGGDNLLALYWLLERNGDASLLGLVDTLLAQTADWGRWLEEMPVREVAQRWDHLSHGVNVAMGLKTPAMRYLADGDTRHRSQLDAGLANLDRYHGQVHGYPSGDEWLAGTDARRGTQLCAVVEAMSSFEQLVRVFGGAEYADRLENLAWNLLPAGFDARMTAHQHLQQANQVLATIAAREWTHADDDATIFGLEPGAGCCAADVHQAWPKLVASMWMATADGRALAAVVHGPSRVETLISGRSVTIETTTAYPFEETIHYHISVADATDFGLALRVPAWCTEPSLRINGEAVAVGDHPEGEAGFLRSERTWQDGDEVELRLPMRLRLHERPSGGVGVSLGPLRLAASPGEIWTRLPDSAGLGDFEVRPRRSWNVGLAVRPDSIDTLARIERFDVGSPPWGSTTGSPPFGIDGVPLKVWLPCQPARGWRIVEDDVPLPPALEPGAEAPDVYRPLVPYGSTRLRIAEFPSAPPSPWGQRWPDQAPE